MDHGVWLRKLGAGDMTSADVATAKATLINNLIIVSLDVRIACRSSSTPQRLAHDVVQSPRLHRVQWTTAVSAA